VGDKTRRGRVEKQELELLKEPVSNAPKKIHSPPRSVYRRKGGLTPEELEAGEDLADYQGEGFPRTRAECKEIPRPCPYVRCRYHLYLDVRQETRFQAIRINFPHLEGPEEMTFSCALDEAGAHPDGLTLDLLAQRLNVTRERVRQLEESAVRKLLHRRAISPDTHEVRTSKAVYVHREDPPPRVAKRKPTPPPVPPRIPSEVRVGDRFHVYETYRGAAPTPIRTVTVVIVTTRSFTTDDGHKWSLRGRTPWAGPQRALKVRPVEGSLDPAQME